jgi:uncharacterized protein YdhG (YjbR/CyaY superfamily)
VVSSKAATVADYLAELPLDRRAEIETVRNLVNNALPAGYVEGMNWGMITWEVPLELSGPTYNGQPLAYAALAAQKNANSLYLNCVYASEDRTERLKAAASADGKKLDMGKSCIRFKRAAQLPLDLIRDEIASTSPEEFVAIYEAARAS